VHRIQRQLRAVVLNGKVLYCKCLNNNAYEQGHGNVTQNLAVFSHFFEKQSSIDELIRLELIPVLKKKSGDERCKKTCFSVIFVQDEVRANTCSASETQKTQPFLNIFFKKASTLRRL